MALTESLTDDFSSEDSGKWNGYGGADAVATSGQLVIACNSGYPGINSVLAYDLTESSFTFQMVNPANAGTGTTQTYVDLANINLSDTKVEWLVQAGTISARYSNLGSYTSPASATYDSTTHAWLRMRNTSGVVYWDTSPDGVGWTNFGSVATPFDITVVRVFFGAGFYGTEPAAGTAVFDNVNLPPAPTTAPATAIRQRYTVRRRATNF